MKYNQPYGISDPNGAYINGNPSTGTAGSIPPAASIEYPQRELVNFINDSGIAPTNSDLHQLSESVQNGTVNYCLDQGTANFIAITPTPAVAAYKLGLHFRIKIANNNTGPTQVNVSNVGFGPLVHSADQSAMVSGELFAGQIIEITWDGTHWQLLSGGTGGGGGLIQLTAPRTFYVDAAIGNNTYDGTTATVDAPHGHGPFLTLRYALSIMAKYNLGGWNFTIQFADGTYNDPALIDMPIPNGSGQIVLRGNPSNPIAVKLINNSQGSVIRCTGGTYYLDGLYFQATATASNDQGSGAWAQGAGAFWFAACAFGPVPGYQVQIGPNGSAGYAGPITITGGGGGHIGCFQNGVIQSLGSPRPTLNITSGAAFSGGFVVSQGGGQQIIVYQSIAGAGLVTGTRYWAISNGVVNSGGNGATYYPGTLTGVLGSGGQYI